MVNRLHPSGGSAAAGGISFQASICAIAYVHSLRGITVPWLDGLSASHPVSISSETMGPGDDISLELADDSIVEIQTKKGLKADKRFWSAMESLCEGISSKKCSFGILIVCPSSSNTIRSGYAEAVKRIGDGRNDMVSSIQQKLIEWLVQEGHNPEQVCARLRIRTVAALSDQIGDVAAAHAELGHICAVDSQISLAWNVLRKEALTTIEMRGRRTNVSLVSTLQASNITIKQQDTKTPAAVTLTLLDLIDSSTEAFGVIGINKRLSTDTAWIQLHAITTNDGVETYSTAEDALRAYHTFSNNSDLGDEQLVDAHTIGTFHKFCVVVGGPGSGKSLLLIRLAREFMKEASVSIRIKLRDLAKRIETTGCTVEEGLYTLGLAATGVSLDELQSSGLKELVLLCDGLDECGNFQSDIASGLNNISVSSPSYRIIVTTRPIGYDTNELRHWRHYRICPLDNKQIKQQLQTLCQEGLSDVDVSLEDLVEVINKNIIGSSKLISKSPLLLGFGAALILNGEYFKDSKPENYSHILNLIERSQAPRRSNAGEVSPAICQYVLNHLGWQVSTKPLSTAGEIEKQCATELQLHSGDSYLTSLQDIQKALVYWEESGLIERLRHGGIEFITFIHKTFAEYTAARYLDTLDKDSARSLIEQELENPDWEEILDFATQTSVAKIIAEETVKRAVCEDLTYSLVDRALGILTRPEISCEIPMTTEFIDRMFLQAFDKDRQKAYRVGASFINNKLSVIPGVEARAKLLLTAQFQWSRLIGWTVLVCHYPSQLERSAFSSIYFSFVAPGIANELFIKPNNPFHDERPDWKVYEAFVLEGLEFLLRDETTERQDELLAEFEKHKPLKSYGSMFELRDTLERVNRLDAYSKLTETFGMDYVGKLDLDFNKFDRANCVLFHDVFGGAFAVKSVSCPPITGMKHLAAFLQLAFVMQVPMTDALVWSPDCNTTSVQELVSAAAFVFGLSEVRLAEEIRYYHSDNVGHREYSGFSDIYSMIPNVDPAEVDWGRSQRIKIDNDILETLVHHPSQWVQYLATYMLHNRLEHTERLESCRRILDNGQGRALLIAVNLAEDLPKNLRCCLILDRLEKPFKPGTQHLFEQLISDDVQINQSYSELLTKALTSSEKTAESTARWCEQCSKSSESWLLRLLKQASQYWKVHELPYPQTGGTVPDSPRVAIYRAQSHFEEFNFTELSQLANDTRRDVRDYATKLLTQVVTDSEDDRSELVSKILEKHFPLDVSAKLLGKEIPFSREDLSKLCHLMDFDDPSYRRISVKLLFHPQLLHDECLKLAAKLKEDLDGGVRDEVYRWMDRFQ